MVAAAPRWRRRRPQCEQGGGGVNKESTLAATATTTAVMEAVKKEVAVKVGWLKGSMPRTRATREEGQCL